MPSEPAQPHGGPPVPEGPPADQRSWPWSCFLVLGRADGADSPLSQSRMIGQLSGQPAFQGPFFEQSGQQAISPSDHRPHPNRSARTSRPTSHRNATAPPHPRPPTRTTTSTVTTYQSFRTKEDTQTTERLRSGTPGPSAGRRRRTRPVLAHPGEVIAPTGPWCGAPLGHGPTGGGASHVSRQSTRTWGATEPDQRPGTSRRNYPAPGASSPPPAPEPPSSQ